MIRLVQRAAAFVCGCGSGVCHAFYQRITQETAKRATSDRKITVADDSLAMLETVLNSAAIMMRTSTLGAVDQSIWDITTDSNIKGLILCCKFAFPVLVNNGSGAFSTIASSHCIRGIGHSVCHPLSKGGIFYLSEIETGQYPSRGLRINCVAAGGVGFRREQRAGQYKILRGINPAEAAVTGYNDAYCRRVVGMVEANGRE